MIDISTYLNRITSQHKTKPKFMALLAARLQPFIDLARCLESFDTAFDLDNAVGKQLDIIGQYIGVERLLNFQPQYAPALLPDAYYRMLLKARISLNNWDGTTEGIQKIWGGVFPNYTIEVVDNQNMTMSVRIDGLQSLFESEIVNHGYITPKPIGVLVNYSVIFRITLDTTLYVASFVYNRSLNKRLPAPPPQTDNSKPPENLYIGGLKTFDSVETEIKGKTALAGVTVTPEKLYAAGKASLNIIGNTTQSKQPPANINPPIIDDYTLGGLYAVKTALASIKEKPSVSAFAPLVTKIYEGGMATTKIIRYALASANQ